LLKEFEQEIQISPLPKDTDVAPLFDQNMPSNQQQCDSSTQNRSPLAV